MEDEIRAFVRFLQVQQGASPETQRSYGADLRQFHTYVRGRIRTGMVVTRSLDASMIREYLAWLDKNGLKKSSLARKLATLRSFYDFLLQTGQASSNPAQEIRPAKQSKYLPRVLSKDDAGALMDFPSGSTEASLRDRAILEVLYSTGARVSELVGLSVGDVLRSEGLVRLRGKGRKERLVPIGNIALEAMAAYHAGHSTSRNAEDVPNQTLVLSSGIIEGDDSQRVR